MSSVDKMGGINDSERHDMKYRHLKNESMGPVEALARGVAHDFNNLLAAIKGRAFLMMHSINLYDPLYRHLVEIIRCIDMGSDIGNQLLGFARADDYYPVTINANHLVRKALDQIDFGGTRVVLGIHLEAEPLMIEADPDKILQVLIALIENALQAMPTGGKLTISTETASILNGTATAYGLDAGTFAKISIADTGRGMTGEVLENIFAPFYSADHERYPEKNGLGLSYAKSIVENHQGVIDVWSIPARGSCFSVILPLKKAFEHEWTDQRAVLENEAVLMVDDEERILKVGREICRVLGYHAITASSGREAVDIFKRDGQAIHLVVLDMIMPDMNGLETFLNLKKIDPDVKVLLSTGYFIDEKAREMMKQGCRGYILKPYSIVDFSNKVRQALDH